MRNLTRAAALVAAAALALTGCGSDDSGGSNGSGDPEPGFTDKSAEEIKAAALEAMGTVTSLSIKGQIAAGGQELGLDLSVDDDGNCEGSISTGGAVAQVISTDGSTFLKGDEKFWSLTAGDDAKGTAMAELVGDRWVDMGESGGFGEFCDLDALVESFEEDDDDEPVTKGETDEIDGVEAIGLHGKDDNGTETIGWVATGSHHYILRFEQVGGEGGQIDFSGFNEELTIAAPSGDDVVDVSELQP